MSRRAACAVFVQVMALGLACAVPKEADTPLTPPGKDGGLELDTGIPVGLDGSPDTGKVDPDAACGAVKEEANVSPVALYIMFDKSQSMVGTKWEGAKAGLKAFLADKASTGLRVAINYFPRDPDSVPACDQPAYKPPKVAFGELPANGPLIAASIDGQTPSGFTTPIYPALGGALLGAIDQVKVKPDEKGAVLLVTDGEPQGPAPLCGGVNPEDPAVIANLANTAYKGAPSISTFVVGLPGVNVAVANQIAAAGGTTSAILATDPTNVEKQFSEALLVVRGKALPCDFLLPTKVTKGEISYSLVNVEYSKGGMPPSTTIPQSPDCAGGTGWRYDDPVKPTKIILCPATCADIRTDFKARVDVLLGCKTKIK